MHKVLQLSMMIVLCLMVFLQSSAQTKEQKVLFDKIASGFNSDITKLPDSLAFYTFAIELHIKKLGDSTNIKSIMLNDSIGYLINKGYDYLRDLNFSAVMDGKKEATIILPVSLIVYNNNNPKIREQQLSFENLTHHIHKLFNYDALKKTINKRYIYLEPLMIYANKAVFD